MSRRALARILWLALLVTVPIPFFLVEIGIEPVAAMVQKLGVTLVLIAADGGAGAITLTAWILGVQAFLVAVLLWLAARVVTYAIVRATGRRAGVVVFGIVAVLLVVACTVPIYRTPFRTGGLYATLPQVFE
jgi:hypothetical protein